MSLKRPKIELKHEWLNSRKIKREHVRNVKLNFVAGILNRFFLEYVNVFALKGASKNKKNKFGRADITKYDIAAKNNDSAISERSLFEPIQMNLDLKRV